MSHIFFNFMYIHLFLHSLISVKIPNVAIHMFATNIILAIDREKGLKLWNHNYKYNKKLIDDYNVIVKSLHIPLSRLD